MREVTSSRGHLRHYLLASQSRLRRLQSVRKSSFEGATGAVGKLDLVFSTGFFGVHLESELDELVNEFAEGNATGFPHFWVHDDRGEARYGVHFVEIDFAAFLLEEEIHAGHTAQFQRAKRIDRILLNLFYLRRSELRGDQELRAFFQIFCSVIIEFAVWDN